MSSSLAMSLSPCPTEEISEPDSHELTHNDFTRATFYLQHRDENDLLKLESDGSSWRLGPVLSEDHIETGDNVPMPERPRGYKLGEIVGTCIATQVEGPNVDLKAFVKIRKQFPNAAGAKNRPFYISRLACKELRTLKVFTDRGSSCTPRLIGATRETQGQEDIYPGGFAWYILTELLPGRRLTDFPLFPLEERDDVRIALQKACDELHSFGAEHTEPSRYSAIWDRESKRCWLIDMQDVNRHAKTEQSRVMDTWSIWEVTHPLCSADYHDPTVEPFVDGSLNDLNYEQMAQVMKRVRNEIDEPPRKRGKHE